jgi:hypothetical protein
MKSRRLWVHLGWLMLVGCGGAQPMKELTAPAAPDAPAMTTAPSASDSDKPKGQVKAPEEPAKLSRLEEAEKILKTAEASILGNKESGPDTTVGRIPSGNNPIRTEARKTPQGKKNNNKDVDAVEQNVGTCPTMCHAISSMKRAVKTICELDGEQGERCKSAKDRLKSSEERVKTCQCTTQ